MMDRSEDKIRIKVVDMGAGFDPMQLRAAGGRAGGFGLFSIRERLHLLGGELEINSAPGRGSEITIVVPPASAEILALASGSPESPHVAVSLAAPPRAATGDARRRIRVLLVDDHIVMRQGLAGLLREAPDIDIIGEASEGETAVNLVRELLPDVVLMDVSLAGMNGIEATRIIHREWPFIRIIGLSMFEEGERAVAMRSAGATEYLTKSGPADAVIDAIRACAPQQGMRSQTLH